MLNIENNKEMNLLEHLMNNIPNYQNKKNEDKQDEEAEIIASNNENGSTVQLNGSLVGLLAKATQITDAISQASGLPYKLICDMLSSAEPLVMSMRNKEEK